MRVEAMDEANGGNGRCERCDGRSDRCAASSSVLSPTDEASGVDGRSEWARRTKQVEAIAMASHIRTRTTHPDKTTHLDKDNAPCQDMLRSR